MVRHLAATVFSSLLMCDFASGWEIHSLDINASGKDLFRAMEFMIDPSDDPSGLLYEVYIKGYLSAAVQGAIFTHSTVTGRSCSLPSAASDEQVVRMTFKFLEDNPQLWDASPTQPLLYAAIQEIIICK